MLVSDMHNVTSLPVCAIFPTDYCVYKTLLEDDEHFEGWSLGHGYVHVISY